MFTKDIKDSDLFGFEGLVHFGLFENDITLYIEKGSNLEYAELCAQCLNSISNETLDNLCVASIKYCNDFLDCVGEEAVEFAETKDVLALIKPNSMSVPIPQNGAEAVINIEFNCTWEEEHGMQWIIRGNEVLYVGAYNGIDPWGDCDRGEEWNYVRRD